MINALFYDPLFSKLSFETVLEVGPGNGKMMDYFSSKGKKVTGVDLHPARADVTKLDFSKNKFPSKSFDLVYSAHVIEHIPHAESFAAELVRVSKKYVAVMAPLPGKKFWDQPDHIRPYTKEALRRIFHVKKTLVCREINLPFFEPVAIIVFDRNESNISTK